MRLAFLKQEVANVHAAALLLGTAGLASRLVGIVRNRLLFAEFGAGRELDIYYAAFQIPDFMAAVFLLGAASAAILPIFQEYLIEDRKKAKAFIAALSTLFFLAALALSAVVFFAVPAIVPLIAPGFSSGERSLMTALVRLMLISPILFGLSGIFSVVLQSFRLFFVYALAPILYNMGIVVGILLFVPIFGVRGLGMGVALGALLHMSVQYIFAARLGFGLTRIPDLVWKFQTKSGIAVGIRKVLVLSFPRVLAISLSQLTVLVLIAIGSTLAEGSVAVFSAAYDLYFVPIGIFAASYAVAVFPRMARAAALDSGRDFLEELSAGIHSILFWVMPAAVLVLVLRAHIVRVGLGAGAFSWEDTRLTAAVLASLCIAMAAGALHILLIRGFYALGNTRIPLAVNAVTSVGTVGIAWALTRALGRASPESVAIAALFRIQDMAHPAVLGMGLAFAAGVVINALALWILLIRAARRRFGIRAAPTGAKTIGQIACAALGAGIAAYAVRASFSQTLPLITFARVLLQGAVAAGAGFGVYWAVLSMLGNEEVGALRKSITRRLFSLRRLPAEWGGEAEK
ncbi:MAG: hypothetical protein A3J10_02335 [Candidatus Sungbacteria bacterium RIFCSPLOWO2_02_FULL_54_10]|nr:MAG: hypothetical protein A3J10_02335 [Candidatus Sungbacteria bacterium RIFCSPLOWO2_02_FULL_54_10]